MLTSGGETVVATNYTEFGAGVYHRSSPWLWSALSLLYGWIASAYRVYVLWTFERRRARRKLGKKVGLMGAAISDYPEVDELVNYIRSKDMRYSCASLRADSLTQAVVDGLADSGQRRLQLPQKRVVNGCVASLIRYQWRAFTKCSHLICKVRYSAYALYIMIGLPTETNEDIEAIVGLAEENAGSWKK